MMSTWAGRTAAACAMRAAVGAVQQAGGSCRQLLRPRRLAHVAVQLPPATHWAAVVAAAEAALLAIPMVAEAAEAAGWCAWLRALLLPLQCIISVGVSISDTLELLAATASISASRAHWPLTKLHRYHTCCHAEARPDGAASGGSASPSSGGDGVLGPPGAVAASPAKAPL